MRRTHTEKEPEKNSSALLRLSSDTINGTNSIHARTV